MDSRPTPDEMQPVFESAAEFFGVLATPMRLRILRVLCDGERTVTQIVDETGALQANVSQHLSVLYRAGIVARTREGNEIHYRVDNEMAIDLCRTVCTRFAMGHQASAESDESSERVGT